MSREHEHRLPRRDDGGRLGAADRLRAVADATGWHVRRRRSPLPTSSPSRPTFAAPTSSTGPSFATPSSKRPRGNGEPLSMTSRSTAAEICPGRSSAAPPARALLDRPPHRHDAHRPDADRARPTGTSTRHLHSFETTFYVLDGEPVLYLEDAAVRLKAGRVWRDPGRRCGTPGEARRRPRWIEMVSPRPRGPGEPAGHVLPRPAARRRAGAARRARPAQPEPLPAHRERHGHRPPEASAPRSTSRRSPRAWRPRRSPTAASRSRCSSTSGSTRSCRRCSWSATSPAQSPIRTTIRSRSRT